MVYVAVPLLSETALPALLPSIWNCTDPLLSNVPLAGVTVAVKVTDWPIAGEVALEVTAVPVDAWATLCVNVGLVLPAKLESPL